MRISQTELILNFASKIRLTKNARIANPAVPSTEFPKPAVLKAAPAIKLSEATLRPSKNAPAHFDRRILERKGALTATKKNAGINIPRVAATAPREPAIKKPINVAVVKTGPGVNCPIAIAITNNTKISLPLIKYKAKADTLNTASLQFLIADFERVQIAWAMIAKITG
jgi:hypothetical protein